MCFYTAVLFCTVLSHHFCKVSPQTSSEQPADGIKLGSLLTKLKENTIYEELGQWRKLNLDVLVVETLV